MTTAHLRDLLSVYGYPLLFFASSIEGTGLPGPIELFFLAAGVLIANGDMSLLAVWGTATAGNVLGNGIGYMIGRWGGRPLFNQVSKWLHFQDAAVARAELWFRRYGGLAQTLSRLIGVTRTPSILGAGVMGSPLPAFLLGSLVGDGIWAAFWTLVGVGVGRHLPFVQAHRTLAVALLFFLLLASTGIFYLLHRRINRH